MTTDRSSDYLTGLVRELCKLPHETEWVEFGMIAVRDLGEGTRSRSYLPYWAVASSGGPGVVV